MKSSKEKRALIAGMIGCLLYVIGDFLFAATGKTQSTESIGLMVKVAYLDMATWRMVVSIICGVLGTALYYIGFHQMWKLLKRHLTQPKQQKWVKLFQIAYLTGTVCWGYVHAMFTNMALIFKFTFEKYGDMQAARNPPDTCWFWYWGWFCCGRRQNAENVRRPCNEIHRYAHGNVGAVCRLIPKAVDGGVRLRYGHGKNHHEKSKAEI